MKVLLLAVVFVATVWCYDEKYDKIDVDKIIADDNLFKAYIDCMLDKGPCKEEYSEDFKKLLPEVIATSCSKCNEIQRQNVRKTVKALSNKKPDEFNEFRKKYDPNREHEKDFAAFVLAVD
ncbi:ejaculatory bulb-specific protein 3 isoform X2 [Manduca sexta]|uniref:Uncharacterized protein n=2 Tax=Manduca sexta TaxID=7130 RepID=A0A921ZAP0_MANSE|nr:ejaculatory bulb-specific protein 3 isoform X2 [Manduca sexta]KAG6454411.1 hypothetical protein O3G_MSEX008664 [Manduca sexta]